MRINRWVVEFVKVKLIAWNLYLLGFILGFWYRNLKVGLPFVISGFLYQIYKAIVFEIWHKM